MVSQWFDVSWVTYTGPCTLGEGFASPEAAAATCSPTGAVDSNIVWDPQTIGISFRTENGSPQLLLDGFNENSISTINGQQTVVEYLGRVQSTRTAAQYFTRAPITTSVADAGQSCPACKNGPDPVNPSSGNEFLIETDIEPVGSDGKAGFARYYNSVDAAGGNLGPGWRGSFSRHLSLEYSNPTYVPGPSASSLYADQAGACTSGWAQVKSQAPGLQAATASFANGTCTLSLNGATVMMLPIYQENSAQPSDSNPALTAVHAYRDDGHIISFTVSSGGFSSEPGVGYRLVTTASGGYQLTDEEDNVETYDSSGKLLSIADRAGNTQTLAYDPATGLLSSVTDNFGHEISFAYDSQHRLQSVAAPDGSSVRYGYDGAGHLAEVTNLDGSTRQYLYTDPNWPSGISSAVDENGQTEFSLSYDSQGRVVSSTLGGVSSSMSFAYNSDGTSTETDPLGAVRTFTFQQVGDHELSSAVTGAPCFTCGYVAATTYDAAGFPAATTDFNGNLTRVTYDDSRGLEISGTQGSGTAVARTISTQWSATYRLPTLISVYSGENASGTPLRTTAFTYDGSGNLLTKTITDPATMGSRSWTFTYDGYGRVLTATDSGGHTSTYTYYTCTSGSQCGELATATDALGHVTTYNSYDADGRALTITDPNGTVTTLTYDARGHLSSRTVAGETTSFSYYPTGLLRQVTLPDASSVSYAYDAAHRLTEVGDGLGNKIVYTLDAMGNRTAESSYDPSGTLHRAHTRVINTLNQVYQEINAAGTAAVATTFGYDNDGNRTSIQAPLARNSTESYDALNRVASITDPASGATSFGYDAEDELTSVSDPRGLATSYGYDGFGDLVSQTSPDTGSTNSTYDAAGNLATSTDARGAVATYGYDALNRVISIAYSLKGTTDQTLSLTYDQGTDGIGHLTGASDANHSMSWHYDTLGELTGMTQTVRGLTRQVAYGYTNGELTSITTPSGQAITYGYNANHEVTSIAVNGKPLLSNVTYEPFGPVDGWTWGNGSTLTRVYDGDGNVTDISGAGGEEVLGYDDASRVSGITNTTVNSRRSVDWTYGYDDLDRLTSAASGTLTEGWTYDADGNRLSQTGASLLTYSISPSSNEVTALTAAAAGPGSHTLAYRYDAAGNTLQGERYTAGYDDAGRLTTLTEGFERTRFTYNALGQMIEARGTLSDIIYAYDQVGHLLGDYDRFGRLIQETVWLGDTPVATLRPQGRSVGIYYVQTDQLNTPRVITRPHDNAIVWRWCSDPFGNGSPTGASGGRRNGLCGTATGRPGRRGRFGGSGPGGFGGGSFTYDLRFPGQVAGPWGSTFQNHYRDYDPGVGRYLEPDPAGVRLIPRDPVLKLGLAMLHYSEHGAGSELNALYAYAGLDPMDNADLMGLDDYSKECVGRYASCGVTQNPSDSWILNLLRLEVCKRSINQVCKRTTPQYCCELDRTSCLANAAGNQKETAQCTVEYEKCVTEGNDK